MTDHYASSNFAPVQELKWLFFDLNSYFASVEQQETPTLRGKPVAIVPADTDSTCAIAASYEAKAYGIKTGMKIYDAKKRCPDLICVLARHDLYVDYHHLIMDEVNNHIPVTKICSVDEAACLLWKNERTLQQATDLAHRIKAGLKQNIGPYVRCSIGLAPNAFLAKIATDMQKPDGLVALLPNQYKEKLFELELRDLCGIGRNMERRLLNAGITTIEQFWNISPKHARKVWGSLEGERFWYELHGYDLPETQTTKRVVGHSRVLDPTHRATDKAYAVAQGLTTKACARLRRYELYAGKFSLGVRTIDQRKWYTEQSFTPMQDNATAITHLKDMWQRMQQATGRINLLNVSVTLHDLYEGEYITPDLFEDAVEKESDNKLSHVMDSLNKRYGANTIGFGKSLKTSAGFLGTKISFTRVPEQEEFLE